MTLIKKNQNKPRTLGYSGIIDFLIELHQEKNFMQILNYITVLAFISNSKVNVHVCTEAYNVLKFD